MNDTTKFESYAIVELMGRNVIAGFVSEQVIVGAGFVRVDIPETPEVVAFTKLFGASAIYAITSTDEATARAVAARLKARPIEPWVMPEPVVHVIGPPAEDPDYDPPEDDEDDDDFNDHPAPF